MYDHLVHEYKYGHWGIHIITKSCKSYTLMISTFANLESIPVHHHLFSLDSDKFIQHPYVAVIFFDGNWEIKDQETFIINIKKGNWCVILKYYVSTFSILLLCYYFYVWFFIGFIFLFLERKKFDDIYAIMFNVLKNTNVTISYNLKPKSQFKNVTSWRQDIATKHIILPNTIMVHNHFYYGVLFEQNEHCTLVSDEHYLVHKWHSEKDNKNLTLAFAISSYGLT